jgi:hypothetical protein
MSFAKCSDAERSLVGQDVILRAGCQPAPDASICGRPGRINNPPQVANLPHEPDNCVTVFCEPH